MKNMAVGLLVVGSWLVAGAEVCVVGPEVPKAWEVTAREEFTNFFGQVCPDGKVSVAGATDVRFHIGDTALAAEKGLTSGAFSNEAWCVKSFGGDVILNGGGRRGALYAVYHFLEDCCGVRFWGTGEVDFPTQEGLTLSALDMKGKPYFLMREIFREGTSDPRIAVRNRLNGNGDRHIPAAFGGGFDYGPPYHIHTWDRRLPFAKYGKEHPEWFSLINGRRVGGQSGGQLCLEAEGLLEKMTELMLADIARGERAAREAGLPPPSIYDFSMNDNAKPCTCEKCRAAQEKYGHSGQMIRFLNEMVRRINRPDLYFSTCAYHYSEPVPTGGIVAAPNVVIKLANTRMNMAAPITDACNEKPLANVRGWKRHCRQTFIHEYGKTFLQQTTGFPYPSEFTLAEKYRIYAENNVQGHLIEHQTPAKCDTFALKYYIEAKLLEDPYRDTSRLIETFMREYYGAAGAKILEARQLLKAARDRTQASITYMPYVLAFSYLTGEFMERAMPLFDAAAAAVRGNAKLERRVAEARKPFDLVQAYRQKYGTKHPPEAGVSDMPFLDFPADENVWYVYKPVRGKGVDFVKEPDLGDPLAGGAWVARISVDKIQTAKLPFLLGIVGSSKPSDLDTRNILSKTYARPIGPGYNWYDLGPVDIPTGFFYVYFKSWYVQLREAGLGLNGTRKLIRAQVKFTGPEFFPGSAEPNEIRIARIVYCDVKE